jgi:hypothetical protein
MSQHVVTKRLLDLAGEETSLTEVEFNHIEKCTECQTVYAKSILQVARARAKNKCQKDTANVGGMPLNERQSQ